MPSDLIGCSRLKTLLKKKVRSRNVRLIVRRFLIFMLESKKKKKKLKPQVWRFRSEKFSKLREVLKIHFFFPYNFMWFLGLYSYDLLRVNMYFQYKVYLFRFKLFIYVLALACLICVVMLSYCRMWNINACKSNQCSGSSPQSDQIKKNAKKFQKLSMFESDNSRKESKLWEDLKYHAIK